MGYIRNRESLLSTGEIELRRIAIDLGEGGLGPPDPGAAVRRYLHLEEDLIRVGDEEFDLRGGQRVFVIGAGKATFAVARAIQEQLGNRIYKGFVTCKHGQQGSLEKIEVHRASHPLPNAASVEAATKTVDLLEEVEPGDLVLACFSGGSSSLFVSPVEGISLEDKAETSRVLLTCGANIIEINNVRKHLSKVKGGRLVQPLPAGTNLINLAVSDVIGDRLDYLTDPSVADSSTFADAQDTLDKYELWSLLPKSVVDHIRTADPETETVRDSELSHLHRTDLVIVGADAACLGVVQAAHQHGLTPLLLSTLFEGDSCALARNLVAIARQVGLDGQPVAAPCVLVAGGETTVTLDWTSGVGGPNQEFAVSAAIELSGGHGIVVLGLDTDGSDGPTEYAGGIADGSTWSIAAAAGIDLHDALSRHDVTPALVACGHVIETGATGTNVNDLKLVLVQAHGIGSSTILLNS